MRGNSSILNECARGARWLAVLVLFGCASKLQVETDPAAPGGGSGGDSGGMGGTVGTETRGTLGKACVPGGTANEAIGSVAQADVTRLDRCDDGLTCGPTGTCIVIPDCPQPTGICALYRAQPADNRQEAGGFGGIGSGGGSSDVAFPEPPIVALAANETALYWVEYGTRDSLGNYQHDGALKSVPLSGGEVTTVSASLPGPLQLWLTTKDA